MLHAVGVEDAEFVEEGAGGIAENFVVEDDFKMGLGVGTL